VPGDEPPEHVELQVAVATPLFDAQPQNSLGAGEALTPAKLVALVTAFSIELTANP
jgi:hypothetical protein